MVQGLVYEQSFTLDIGIAIFLHCLGLTLKAPITTKVILLVVCLNILEVFLINSVDQDQTAPVCKQSFTFDIRVAIFLHCLGLTLKAPITTKVICFVVC